MNSPYTGKPMPLKASKANLEYKGEMFEITMVYFHCPYSNEQFTNEDLDKINLYQAYQQYAEKHNLPVNEPTK